MIVPHVVGIMDPAAGAVTTWPTRRPIHSRRCRNASTSFPTPSPPLGTTTAQAIPSGWNPPNGWGWSGARSIHSICFLTSPDRGLHSQLDFGAFSRGAKVANREPVWLNPDDAAARGIATGDVVRICNDRGACLAGAEVMEVIRSGVIQLATGAWFDPLDPSEIGSLDKPGNPNVLTLDKGTSKLPQCSVAQAVLPEVERFASEPRRSPSSRHRQ